MHPNFFKQKNNFIMFYPFQGFKFDFQINNITLQHVNFLHCSIGFKIVGCIKMTDKTLGSILFTEFGMASVNLGLCTYFVLTIYVLFSPPLAWVVLIFIIANGLGVTVSILRLWQLTVVCEQLNESLMLAKDHIQGYQVS